MEKNIVVVGSMNQDIIMKIARMPDLGESMMVDECILAAGGKGCNQAVQASKLGANVSMVGAVGKDAMGEFLLTEAEKYHVNISHVKKRMLLPEWGTLMCFRMEVYFVQL